MAHNFNRSRQDYLTALFRKDDKECIKLLGESWKKYEVPSPAPKWGSKYWDEQVQIAVRKVARREWWSYYDFNTEYASSAYYGSSRKMRAENQMAYINHCLARQERFRKEIELNGE